MRFILLILFLFISSKPMIIFQLELFRTPYKFAALLNNLMFQIERIYFNLFLVNNLLSRLNFANLFENSDSSSDPDERTHMSICAKKKFSKNLDKNLTEKHFQLIAIFKNRNLLIAYFSRKYF